MASKLTKNGRERFNVGLLVRLTEETHGRFMQALIDDARMTGQPVLAAQVLRDFVVGYITKVETSVASSEAGHAAAVLRKGVKRSRA